MSHDRSNIRTHSSDSRGRRRRRIRRTRRDRPEVRARRRDVFATSRHAIVSRYARGRRVGGRARARTCSLLLARAGPQPPIITHHPDGRPLVQRLHGKPASLLDAVARVNWPIPRRRRVALARRDGRDRCRDRRARGRATLRARLASVARRRSATPLDLDGGTARASSATPPSTLSSRRRRRRREASSVVRACVEISRFSVCDSRKSQSPWATDPRFERVDARHSFARDAREQARRRLDERASRRSVFR